MTAHDILIVDDEPHILKSLTRLLRPEGFTIHTATGGEEAVKILSETDFAVVISDQRMPGMSGAEVLAEAYRLRPDAIRITLTGYTDLAAAQASINNGHVQQFLLKPWDDDRLKAVIHEAIRTHGLAAENARLQAEVQRQRDELEKWNKDLSVQVRDRTAELADEHGRLIQAFERQEQSLRDTVAVLTDLIEAAHPAVGIHSRRMAAAARQIAAQINAQEHEIRDAEFAALLHEIGRMAPRNVQDGAKRTDPAQDDLAEIGYRLLSKISGFDSVAEAVRCQNESYAGLGGPGRLKRAEIPLASRILSAVEAYDAVAYASGCQSAKSCAAGIQTVKDGAGTRFDPVIADALSEYLSSLGSGDEGEVEMSASQIRVGMVLARDVISDTGSLLIKEGVALTHAMIDRLISLSATYQLQSGIYVRGTGDEARRDNGPGHSTGKATGTSSSTAATSQRTGREISDPRVKTGQRFTATLPTRAAPSPRHQAEETPPPLARILVVDDSESVCAAVRRDLRQCGYESAAAASGVAALTALAGSTFDLVLTDLFMPMMSGQELIEKLLQEQPGLPCVIMTANPQRDRIILLGKLRNVRGILVKPWQRERLIDTVRAALNASKVASAGSKE